jgi:uncharacterized peroxidase-related enzyme
MSTFSLVTDEAPATAATFTGVKKQLGIVPNLFRVIANSPQGLAGYLGLSGALGRGVLPAHLRERIALLTAETNGCDYCLSAHAYLGAGAGLTEADIDAAIAGTAAEAKDRAALALATALIARQGRGAEAELTAARAAGWDDAAIVEIAEHVALNVLTNTVNNLAGTPIDFPVRRTGG